MKESPEEINLLTDETIKVICILHYINAPSTKAINFIDDFVKKIVELKLSVDEYFSRYYPGKVNLIGNIKISKFKEVYELFSKKDVIDCNKYYYDLRYLKHSVYDMIFMDIKNFYKINCKLDYKDQIYILSNLIKFDLNSPFKYRSQPYRSDKIPEEFLYAYSKILYVRTENPYSYVEDKEVTVEIKKGVLSIINSHLSSKKHVPKYSQGNHKSVRELIRYLKSSLIPWHGCIFIVPKKINKIELYGNVFYKSDSPYSQLLEKTSTIVTDKYNSLNNPTYKNYKIYMVDEEGTLNRYIEETGELHREEGYVRVS